VWVRVLFFHHAWYEANRPSVYGPSSCHPLNLAHAAITHQSRGHRGLVNIAGRTAVEIGDSAGDRVAVTGPTSAGDRVAIRGAENLQAGSDAGSSCLLHATKRKNVATGRTG
jgi:hypothetical protein